MKKSKIDVDKVVAGIKENLAALRTIKSEDLTEKERIEFRKDIDELQTMALAIKNRAK